MLFTGGHLVLTTQGSPLHSVSFLPFLVIATASPIRVRRYVRHPLDQSGRKSSVCLFEFLKDIWPTYLFRIAPFFDSVVSPTAASPNVISVSKYRL